MMMMERADTIYSEGFVLAIMMVIISTLTFNIVLLSNLTLADATRIRSQPFGVRLPFMIVG
jgi:hypothetical protein